MNDSLGIAREELIAASEAFDAGKPTECRNRCAMAQVQALIAIGESLHRLNAMMETLVNTAWSKPNGGNT